MRVRSANEVLDILDEEYSWRRKELTMIWNDVKSSKPKSRAARTRAAVAILYAHWEGFVKVASEVYLSYVAGKRLKHSELNNGILALCLRAKLRRVTEEHDISGHIEFLAQLSRGLDSRAKVPTGGIIRTGANLSSSRLKSIVLSLGLDYTPFELKEKLIDDQLLNCRNNIAHGRWACPREGEFDLLYNEMTLLLRNFKDQISNAIALGLHLKITKDMRAL